MQVRVLGLSDESFESDGKLRAQWGLNVQEVGPGAVACGVRFQVRGADKSWASGYHEGDLLVLTGMKLQMGFDGSLVITSGTLERGTLEQKVIPAKG